MENLGQYNPKIVDKLLSVFALQGWKIESLVSSSCWSRRKAHQITFMVLWGMRKNSSWPTTSGEVGTNSAM